MDAKSRVYVRRINFLGVDEIDDEVLRREMRQAEGAYLSNRLIDRSKIRLQRLPYVESVAVENAPVPGSPDLVDVNFMIEYRMPGQFSGGVGYSQAQDLMLQGSIVHSNFLGTGERVALNPNSGRIYKLYSLSHTDPYVTQNGVQRTITLSHRESTALLPGGSDFSTENSGASLEYGYPISELQSLSFGLAYQQPELLASGTRSSQQLQDWVGTNGNPHGDGQLMNQVRCEPDVRPPAGRVTVQEQAQGGAGAVSQRADVAGTRLERLRFPGDLVEVRPRDVEREPHARVLGQSLVTFELALQRGRAGKRGIADPAEEQRVQDGLTGFRALAAQRAREGAQLETQPDPPLLLVGSKSPVWQVLAPGVRRGRAPERRIEYTYPTDEFGLNLPGYCSSNARVAGIRWG